MNAPSASDQAIEFAAKAGCDINLIECNLALSVEERWRQHNLALGREKDLLAAKELRAIAAKRSQP